jgi:hypothetical protein
MAVENYQRMPGRGPSAIALKRMRKQIMKPEEPMGEAWFMSEERLLYSEMMEQDPMKLSDRYLKDVLWEIASGTKCFGHLEEWDQWFQFLLPAMIEKSHVGFELLEDTIGAFFNVFDKASPSLSWHYDFLNEPAINERDFLPEVNVQAFLDKVRQEIDAETLFQWIDSFSHQPALQETLWTTPDIYFDKFISGN